GLRWAVLPGQGRTTVYWIFDPPACGDLPLETHEHRQTGFVLGGDFTLLYEGGRSQQLHAGDHYAIEPGLLHGASFQSRTVLCDVYEPVKEDFEQLAAKVSGER
ncbi:MAG: cupin domain-containing protein, partial [Candidatus Eremiobacteraeota bacterium]|nr:cupin domain-containing protein [Candidatus Eremiobacteraeota bacterium]